MTARTTMSNLLSTLRGMTNAGTADFTVGSSTYWSDDQLQTILDRYVNVIRDETLSPSNEISTGGTVIYKDYQSKSRFFETTLAGTAQFVIRNPATGNVAGTADWSANYETGLVSFASDTKGTVYSLTGRSYDVYAAAADVWEQKAGRAADMISFTTAGHTIKRDNVFASCMAKSRQYRSMATMDMYSGVVELIRGDSNV